MKKLFAVQAPAPVAAPVATTATDTAEPEFQYGRLTFEKPATPEQIAAAQAKISAGKTVQTLQFEAVDDATIAAAIAAFPGARQVTVRKTAVTTLAPFAQLKDATEVAVKDADLRAVSLAPLASLPKLKTFAGTYSKFADLSPLAACPELKDVDFYGAEVTSFAPLAACPKLERVYFYAAKTTPEGYASLGALKQVKRFHGGLTKMTDISWLRQVPQAEEVKIFAEKIPDLTPLQALPNLTYVRLWNMKGGNFSTVVGDLSLLAGNVKLKRLELPGSSYSNLGALASLQELEVLDLSNAQGPVDVSVVAKLPKLRSLNVSGSAVVNGASIPASVRVSKDKKTTGL